MLFPFNARPGALRTSHLSPSWSPGPSRNGSGGNWHADGSSTWSHLGLQADSGTPGNQARPLSVTQGRAAWCGFRGGSFWHLACASWLPSFCSSHSRYQELGSCGVDSWASAPAPAPTPCLPRTLLFASSLKVRMFSLRQGKYFLLLNIWYWGLVSNVEGRNKISELGNQFVTLAGS